MAFAVAWRRVADLPLDIDEARAWLFGIGRKLVLAEHRYGRTALTVQLDREIPVLGHEDAVVAALDLASAWNRLPPVHQEGLSLTVWDGLSGAHAAAVLDISPAAYRIRHSRARTCATRPDALDGPTVGESLRDIPFQGAPRRTQRRASGARTSRVVSEVFEDDSMGPVPCPVTPGAGGAAASSASRHERFEPAAPPRGAAEERGPLARSGTRQVPVEPEPATNTQHHYRQNRCSATDSPPAPVVVAVS